MSLGCCSVEEVVKATRSGNDEIQNGFNYLINYFSNVLPYKIRILFSTYHIKLCPPGSALSSSQFLCQWSTMYRLWPMIWQLYLAYLTAHDQRCYHSKLFSPLSYTFNLVNIRKYSFLRAFDQKCH